MCCSTASALNGSDLIKIRNLIDFFPAVFNNSAGNAGMSQIEIISLDVLGIFENIINKFKRSLVQFASVIFLDIEVTVFYRDSRHHAEHRKQQVLTDINMSAGVDIFQIADQYMHSDFVCDFLAGSDNIFG